MNRASDAWYVRLPDGRVLRAASTEAVRHHIRSGRIPPDSRVRRSPDEEWSALEWTQEFTEVYEQSAHAPRPVALANEGRVAVRPARPAGIASRLDPLQLQTVGIRGAVEELLAALDSTMVRVKLRVAAVTGLLTGAAFALMYLIVADPELGAPWWGWLVFGGVVAFAASVCQTLLTQMTYAEVTQLRAARWEDARARLPRSLFQVYLANLIVFGATLAALWLLRHGPEQFQPWYVARYGEERLEAYRDLIAVGAFLGELLLWPVLGFGLLLAPLIVVEECSAPRALWQWLRLLGRHLGEVFLYQAVALSMGMMVTLPLGITLGLAAWGMARGGIIDRELQGVLHVFAGVALTPLIAYLVVANLFVYLHMRYEQGPRQK